MKLVILLILALTASISFSQLISADSSKMVNLNMIGRINAAKGVDINSNSLVDLNSVAGNLVHIVGTSTITSFGSASQTGIMRHVIFDGAVVVTYNAATLVVPGSTTFTTAAGDYAIIAADTISGAVPPVTKWVILDYRRKSTAP
jgi:hypothetical protein